MQHSAPGEELHHQPGAPSGVRTEHDLRIALREMTERNERLTRACQTAHRYAHGRQEGRDLTDLKRVLASPGFPYPKPPAHEPSEDE